MMRAVIDHLWQSTLFCAVIWLITLALRESAAALRHRLWMLASLKFLVPFSALYFIGAVAGLPTPVESQPIFAGAVEAAAPVISPALALGPATAGPGLLAPLLAAAWALGVAWLALAWLRGWRMAAYLSRAARPAPGALPDVHVTDADVEPSVARVFRPVVLLPAALLGRLTRPQLEAVLAHEREHIERHDNLLANLHRLVETLFWFHPLAWFIGRHLQEERELACDEAVLAGGHDPGDYAGGILAVCRHCVTARRPYVAAALAGDVTARIRHILRSRPPATLGSLQALTLVTCSMAVTAIPLAAGAMDGGARRHEALTMNQRALRDARIVIQPAEASGETRIVAAGNAVDIGNISVRELIALAYGASGSQILIRGTPLDARYDIRVETGAAVADPDHFDPQALESVVPKLLASHFGLELYVNQRCQEPCGPRALEVTVALR